MRASARGLLVVIALLAGPLACTALLGLEPADVAAVDASSGADAACAEGRATCDPRSRCAVELATDPTHCGSCGRACGGPHATGVCAAGQCSLRCDPGFCDGDGLPENGCEAALDTDRANCGRCGRSCLGGQCLGGQCQPVLVSKYRAGVTDLAHADGSSAFVHLASSSFGTDDDAGTVARLSIDGRQEHLLRTPPGSLREQNPVERLLLRVGDELLIFRSDATRTQWTVLAYAVATGAERCVTTFRTAAFEGSGVKKAIVAAAQDGGILVGSPAPTGSTLEIRHIPASASCAGGAIPVERAVAGDKLDGIAETADGRVWLAGNGLVVVDTDGGATRMASGTPAIASDTSGLYAVFAEDATLRKLDPLAPCGDAGVCGSFVSGPLSAGSGTLVLDGSWFVLAGADGLSGLTLVDRATGAVSVFGAGETEGLFVRRPVTITPDGSGVFWTTGGRDVYYLAL